MWIVLSVFAALTQGTKDIFSKNLTRKYDEYILGFFGDFGVVLFLLPYVLWTGLPHLGPHFASSLAIAGLINAFTVILVFRALRMTDLSLVAPIYSLSPVFLLVTSPFILGEFPTPLGLVGVFLILAGTYGLNFSGKVNFQPFIEIFRNKGQRLIVLATILWSISSNYYKIGMANSSPIFFIFMMSLVVIICLFPFMLAKKGLAVAKKDWRSFLILGLLAVMLEVFQWTAVSQGLVVYVLAIKRLSILVSVGGAFLFLKERHSFQRLFATSVMIVGVVLILVM